MKGLRKNGWKFILDILMALLLALMYNKRALGIAFHEIGGLALCGLFIIHKLLNWKWIKAVSTGLFSRRVNVQRGPSPARSKTYGEWPNARDSQRVPGEASLRGDHAVRGNYTPDIRFSLEYLLDQVLWEAYPEELLNIKDSGK